MEDRLEKCLLAVTYSISKNDLLLFGSPQPSKSKTKQQITALKNDCNLFALLYIACQTRDGNLEEFFKHENQSTPPSLSTIGKIRIGHKSDLPPCLETGTLSEPPVIDVKILDGAAIGNMLPHDHRKTFEEYAKNVFLPYLEAQARNVKRLDVVWDRYIQDSLKNIASESRGQSVRKWVVAAGTLPANWQSFLRCDRNKVELFEFLAQQVTAKVIQDKELLTTYNEDVISALLFDKEELSPCNHEEADTRMLLHAAHASRQGHSKIMIRTVDTDVVILAIANVYKIRVSELWIALGTGKQLRYIPVHTIAHIMTPLP